MIDDELTITDCNHGHVYVMPMGQRRACGGPGPDLRGGRGCSECNRDRDNLRKQLVGGIFAGNSIYKRLSSGRVYIATLAPQQSAHDGTHGGWMCIVPDGWGEPCVRWTIVDANVWASIVATVCCAGESLVTYTRALELHNGGPIIPAPAAPGAVETPLDLEVLRQTLCDACQLLDGWHADGTAWTSWDESVRQRVGEALKTVCALKASARSAPRLVTAEDVTFADRRNGACGTVHGTVEWPQDMARVLNSRIAPGQRVEAGGREDIERAAKVCEREAQRITDDPENGYVESDTNAMIWTNDEAAAKVEALDDAAMAIRALPSAPPSAERILTQATDVDFDEIAGEAGEHAGVITQSGVDAIARVLRRHFPAVPSSGGAAVVMRLEKTAPQPEEKTVTESFWNRTHPNEAEVGEYVRGYDACAREHGLEPGLRLDLVVPWLATYGVTTGHITERLNSVARFEHARGFVMGERNAPAQQTASLEQRNEEYRSEISRLSAALVAAQSCGAAVVMPAESPAYVQDPQDRKVWTATLQDMLAACRRAGVTLTFERLNPAPGTASEAKP